MESIARTASNAAAKIFVPVAKCFLGIVKKNKFTRSFLKGVVALS
jgi:hypothetical protein